MPASTDAAAADLLGIGSPALRTVSYAESERQHARDRRRLRVKVAVCLVMLVVLGYLSLGIMGAAGGTQYIYCTAYAVYSPQQVAWVLYLHAYNFLGSTLHLWDVHPTSWLIANAPGYWAVPGRAGVIGITLVSACLLAVAGMLYQNVFKNPIATPGMLGASSGVNLGMMLLVYLYGTAAPSMTTQRYVLCYACGAAVLVVVIAGGKLMSGRGRAFNDVEENYVIFALVAVVVPVLAFLLSRRRWGLVVLLVAGSLACGLIQFLYRDWLTQHAGLQAASAFLAAVGALFVYQSYRSALYGAQRARNTSFPLAFGFALLVGALCVACGLGAFYGVVDGLGLQTPEVKLFERYAAQPVEEVTGVYDVQEVEGDETTDELSEEEKETNASALAGIQPDELANSLGSTQVGGALAQALGYSSADSAQEFRAIGYFILASLVLLLVLLVALAIVAAVLLRRRQRQRRLARIARQTAAWQVRWLYRYLLRCFKRLGIERPPQLTPLEYAREYERVLRPFACEEEGIDFMDVTRAYVLAAYSQQQPSPRQLEQVRTYYLRLFEHARLHVGKVRWALWYFWRV